MTKENVAEVVSVNEGYDFAGKDPRAVLTEDELEHFEEGMRLKNHSRPANELDFGRAVKSTVQDLPKLFS
jgi:hypothetical protein